jgi:hypothetical protein
LQEGKEKKGKEKKTEKILLYSPFSPLDDVDKMKAPSPAMSDSTGEHDI